MRTRSFWLLGGMLAVAAGLFIVGHSALAGQALLELDTTEYGFPLGGETTLEVTVDPSVVGGSGELYQKLLGEITFVESFRIVSTNFTITAPIPADPTLLGRHLAFRFRAYDSSGELLGTSTAARGPIVEPEPEEF